MRQSGHLRRARHFEKGCLRPFMPTESIRGDSDVEVQGGSLKASVERRFERFEGCCVVIRLEGGSTGLKQPRAGIVRSARAGEKQEKED
jgi:hypothetical protein